ncbi:MAG: ferric iron uptake transcriptional regulator [Zoogloeaceae bacterium]|jgi:Fur family ferric uptake transcriptional regulator|nr:ferric iron uptake transcriptional regulator [Zoogloeaceae bacterium]
MTHKKPVSSHSLKSAGLKATLPRLKILALFEHNAARHLDAEEVYRLLLAEGLDIGLATVYRVLTQFEQAGFLARHTFKSGRATFEINEGGHHDHLICMDCGHVEEFCDTEIERRQKAIAARRGFKIEEHALSLYAHCQREDCPNRQAAEKREAERQRNAEKQRGV